MSMFLSKNIKLIFNFSKNQN